MSCRDAHHAAAARSMAVVAAAILGVALPVACDDQSAPPSNRAHIPDNAPDEETRNTTILITDSAWTRARVQVGRARKYYGRGETLLDSGVFVEFFGREGEITATLLADSARIDDRTSDMTAWGNVHAESQGGQQLVDTPTMTYHHDEQEIRSDARVEVVDREQGRNLRGVGFRSDLSMTDYTIFNITGTFSVSD